MTPDPSSGRRTGSLRATIKPEPTPEERDAIEQALVSIEGARGAQQRGEWWQAGIRENVLDEEVPGADA